MRNIVTCIAASMLLAAPVSANWKSVPGTYAVFNTSQGRIVCHLFERQAPKTVENLIGLAEGNREFTDPRTGKPAKRKFYDGIIFHRVIPGFMIQGGDPLGKGTGGPGYQFEDEIVPGLSFDRPGRLAMANAGPGTNGSQFFITVAPTPWLNGNHTIFGQVVEGQEVANRIANLPRNQQDKPLQDVVINSLMIEKVAEMKPGKLSGRKALFIVAKDFRDEEYFVTRDILHKDGAQVVTASLQTGELPGMMGGKTRSDVALDDVQVKEYDLVAFIGGSGASVYFSNGSAHKLAKDAVEQGKVVGAICIAPSILANAGVLQGKKATSFSSEKNNLTLNGAHFIAGTVVQDGRIITASGPEAVNDFGKALAAELLKQN